ncbi:MAG: hypothetical protein RLN77_11785, partial [Rhodospirillales bacterium]
INCRGATAKNWGSMPGGAIRLAVAGTRPWLDNNGGLMFELAPSGSDGTAVAMGAGETWHPGLKTEVYRQK